MTRAIVASSALLVLLGGAALAADAGLGQETPDQWRASKLAGVPIYGPDDKRIGKITDVLLGHDGKAQDVIVGIGGFLGIGEKDVAVPFDQVVFSDEPVTAPPSTMGATPASAGAAPDDTGNAPAGMTDASGVAPAAGTVGIGTPAANTTAGAAPDMATSGGAPIVRSTAYPDHGRISLTVDQLKSAPSFHFAR